MKYNLVSQDDQSNLTLFLDGEMYVADSSHPNFDRIVQGVLAEDASVTDLFDVSRTAATQFEKVTRRVSVANGVVYFDGESVENALTKQIARAIEEGAEDFKPLVNFFEKVANNQNEHSRKQLFEWLDRHDFTITKDGNFIAYKGVRADFTSVHAGPAIVDGKAVNGHVPNPVGATVEIARGSVMHDPAVGCASGLHAGTWAYASTFGHGPTLKVEIDPADVVSVPTDCNAQKLRVCRYVVLEQVAAPENTVFSTWGDYEADECDECGITEDDAEIFDGLCDECFEAQEDSAQSQSTSWF